MQNENNKAIDLLVNKIVSISGVKQIDKDKWRFTVTVEGTTRLFTYTNNDESIAREDVLVLWPQ